ncbi:MAG TPA: tyrosine-type recombinase/integrase [Jiangellales bacterium]|nr:tyrosine-type recombinase/integrase [Jiangellales bacterium]
MADHIDGYLTYLRRRRSPSTTDTYAAVLARLDRELPKGLARANTEELSDWLYAPRQSANGNETRLAAASTALYRTIICSFFTWACDPRDPRLTWNPAALLAEPPTLPHRSPRPLTEEELAAILDRATEPYATWITLAAFDGLRCCEISALDREHITEHSIWITGKGSHKRTIPTDPYVWAAVRDLPPGPVARLVAGNRASRQYVARRGNLYLHRRLGLPDVTMHRFRHTFATMIYKATGDILLVKELLGHASVSTTQLYAQVASPAMVAAVASLPRLRSRRRGAA